MAKLDKYIWKIYDRLSLTGGGKIVMPNGRTSKSKGLDKDGYKRIHIVVSNRLRNFSYARIVCTLAHGLPPTSKYEVDHINRNRSDDRPENLRWLTKSEQQDNISDEAKAVRLKNTIKMGRANKGSKHWCAKLNAKKLER